MDTIGISQQYQSLLAFCPSFLFLPQGTSLVIVCLPHSPQRHSYFSLHLSRHSLLTPRRLLEFQPLYLLKLLLSSSMLPPSLVIHGYLQARVPSSE